MLSYVWSKMEIMQNNKKSRLRAVSLLFEKWKEERKTTWARAPAWHVKPRAVSSTGVGRRAKRETALVSYNDLDVRQTGDGVFWLVALWLMTRICHRYCFDECCAVPNTVILLYVWLVFLFYLWLVFATQHNIHMYPYFLFAAIHHLNRPRLSLSDLVAQSAE